MSGEITKSDQMAAALLNHIKVDFISHNPC